MAETNHTAQRRCAELDLLRILSMLLIILMHSIDHSGVLEAADRAGGAEAFFVRFLYMLTQISVNCYVMLSGYFMVRSRFRLQKLAALWLETVFYALVIRLVFMLSGERAFSPVSLISCFFPFFTGRYWFITIYVGMYLLSPFLNLAIRAMDKRQHGLLNLTLLALFSVWSSLHPAIAGMNSGGGWGLAWFIVLYFSAAWLARYYTPSGKVAWKILFWIGTSVTVALVFCLLGGKFRLIKRIAGTWYHYNSLPAVTATFAVFIAFLNLKIRNEKLARGISAAASTTLGVYLIHAHADLSPFLWDKLDLPSKMDHPLFFPFLLCVVLMVFVCCALLDYFRRISVGRLEKMEALAHFCKKVESMFMRLVERIL